MSVLKKVEDLLERRIDGFFNRRLKSNLKLEEIAAKLQRSVEEMKAEEDGVVYAPNKFMIYINEDDYLKLQPDINAVAADLTDFITVYSEQRKYIPAGEIKVRLFCGETSEYELLRVIAEFDEPQNYSVSDDSFTTQTAVFDKVSEEINLYREQNNIAELKCTFGPDSGKQLSIGSGRINIGRWDNSDFRLADHTVSRLHAYILFIEGEHVLHDAGSANGTYVNKRRIAFKVLASGDEIKLGNTVLVYIKN